MIYFIIRLIAVIAFGTIFMAERHYWGFEEAVLIALGTIAGFVVTSKDTTHDR